MEKQDEVFAILQAHHKNFSQDQRSVEEQLHDLYVASVLLKMYDAADFILNHINENSKRKECFRQYIYELKRRKKHG